VGVKLKERQVKNSTTRYLVGVFRGKVIKEKMFKGEERATTTTDRENI